MMGRLRLSAVGWIDVSRGGASYLTIRFADDAVQIIIEDGHSGKNTRRATYRVSQKQSAAIGAILTALGDDEPLDVIDVLATEKGVNSRQWVAGADANPA